jgi:hypothetical protein
MLRRCPIGCCYGRHRFDAVALARHHQTQAISRSAPTRAECPITFTGPWTNSANRNPLPFGVRKLISVPLCGNLNLAPKLILIGDGL